jgi:hypothetical protein
MWSLRQQNPRLTAIITIAMITAAAFSFTACSKDKTSGSTQDGSKTAKGDSTQDGGKTAKSDSTQDSRTTAGSGAGGSMTWTVVEDGTFNRGDFIREITYGGGKFVAVGDGGKMWYSSDGVKWIADSTFDNNTNAIAYGGGKFVTTGDDGTAYSSDGITWTTDSDYFCKSAIVYGSNKFVVSGWGDGSMAYSTGK